MKKYLSVLELYAYAPMKKCLIITFIMAASNVLLSYLYHVKEIRYYSLSWFPALLVDIMEYSFYICFIALFLCLSGISVFRGKSGYTLYRLGVSKGARYWIKVLVNAMYIVLYYLASTVSNLLYYDIAEEKGLRISEDLEIVFWFVDDGKRPDILPIHSVPRMILLPLLILILSVWAASIATRRVERGLQ